MKTGLWSSNRTWIAMLIVSLSSSVSWGFPPPQSQQQPKDRTPPTVPGNLHVTGISDYSVTVSWTPSTDNSGSWTYRVVSSAGVTAFAPQYYTSYSFTTNHVAGNTYSFHVYAIDAAGNKSANSNTVSATLLPAGTGPSAPVVTVSETGPTHVSLAWSQPFDCGPTAYFFVYRDGVLVTYASQATTYTDENCAPQSTHTYTVVARDGKVRYSPHSSPLAVTTPAADPNDHTPPSAPAGVWADPNYSAPEFFLMWGASTDNVTPQAYIRYDIYLNGNFIGVTVGDTWVTDYAVPGENVIEVFATDEAGNRSLAGTTSFNSP